MLIMNIQRKLEVRTGKRGSLIYKKKETTIQELEPSGDFVGGRTAARHGVFHLYYYVFWFLKQ